MKTLFSTVFIAVMAIGLLLAFTPNKAEAWYRGPVVGFSVVVPPVGISIGAPAPYYYPGPVYAAPYPVYRRAYYGPYYGRYYGYGPYYRYRHPWYYGRGYRYWRY